MADGPAPAPREQGWTRIALALAAFLLVPLVPSLRAVVPVEHTALLLAPALAVCFVVGWWAGGRLWHALLWVGLAGWLLAVPAPPGADAYFDLARAWGLLVAGAFGVMCVAGRGRRFLDKALPALGLALLLALLLAAIGQLALDAAERVFVAQFASRNSESATALQEFASRVPSARVWTDQSIQILTASSALAAPFFPAALALEALAACALAWAMYHRLARSRLGAPLAPFREFRFSDQLVWGLIAGVVIVTVPALTSVAAFGRNLLAFFGVLYVLRGLGVLAWFISRAGRPIMVLTAAAGIVLWPMTVLTAFCLGLGDTWFDWRRERPATRSR
jgi:Predicted membrane protein (DUF2232)